jgi:hypothetical protein
MTRPVILILIALLMAGCKNQQSPTADPFFGRTTVPPPPTGSSTGHPVDPSYQAPPLAQTSPQAPLSTAPPYVQMPGPMSSTAATPSPQNAASSGIASPVSTPRPSSTVPGISPVGRSAPVTSPPGAAPPYVPPGGNFNYRGTSTQGSAPLVPTQPETRTSLPSTFGVSTNRTIGPADDRTPRPVDDTSANANAGGQKLIVRTLQPRPKDDASGRPIDIADLPTVPGSGTEVRLTQPARP